MATLKIVIFVKPDEKIKFYFMHFDYTQEGTFVMLYENSEILLTKRIWNSIIRNILREPISGKSVK